MQNIKQTMYEKHHTQQEITAQLAEIHETMKREKIELSPEMQKYFNETLARFTEGMTSGEMPVKKDLDEFIKTIKEYIENERFLKDLEVQYQKRLETGAYFELYDKDNPVVEGIDGKKYPAPTWDEIKQVITHKHVEKVKKYIKNPMLLVVPIAMPLEKIALKVGAKKGKLPEQKPVEFTYDLYPDRSGDYPGEDIMVYFPERYDKNNPGGLSKSDLLKLKGGFNKFPGWQVLIVDGDDEVQNDSINKSAEDLLVENDTLGITGITPEEWLILHGSGVEEKGQPFDLNQWTLCMASYLKNLGTIPACIWGRLAFYATLHYYLPDDRSPGIGSRRSVRIW